MALYRWFFVQLTISATDEKCENVRNALAAQTEKKIEKVTLTFYIYGSTRQRLLGL